MKLSEKEIDFDEFIKPEYFTSSKGSSFGNLKKAAEDHGMYAIPLEKLTSRELRDSVYPIILHVKSAKDKKKYDHFELFLGTENGEAKLFNPPESMKLVPFYKLAPRWDGTGLVVSAGPIDTTTIFAPARKRILIYVTMFVAMILLVRWCRHRWLPAAAEGRWKSRMLQSVSLRMWKLYAIMN
jgi:hypothetical protein